MYLRSIVVHCVGRRRTHTDQVILQVPRVSDAIPISDFGRPLGTADKSLDILLPSVGGMVISLVQQKIDCRLRSGVPCASL